MARYSIEDTTLTALGDAIRSKVGETKEIEVPLEPYRLSYNESIDGVEDFTPNGSTITKKTVFPILNSVKKVKIICNFKKYHSLDKLHLTVEKAENGYSVSTKSIEEDCENQTVYLEHTYPNNEEMQVGVCVVLPGYNRGQYDASFDVTIYQINNNNEIIETVKKTVTNTMTPSTMAEAINNMAATPPDAAFKISGNCMYKFYGGGWDWYIELFGDKITTEDLNNGYSMFQNSQVEYIPFDINLGGSNPNLSSMFGDCINLKELPRLKAKTKFQAPTSKYNFIEINKICSGCRLITEIPEDYFDAIVEDGYWDTRLTLKADGEGGSFQNCYSLRRVSPNIYKAFMSGTTAYYNSLYYNLHNNNYVLDEIVNLPVEPGPYTSDCFNSTFYNCFRLSRATFETNEDGTPKTANWKGQIIKLGDTTSGCVGYAYSTSHKNNVLNYGGGVITADKEVKDDETYAALKNDPDWFGTSESYSRYNKLSAIETISTLPDCSASGGTNTIRFRGVAGGKTDGGAINTMTEEEIAVAAAKGWTVSFV